MKEQALSGLKVVEWGSFISAPFCTKFLADLGAEVIKVEPPGSGDQSRRYGPFPNDIPYSEKSGLFLYLNTNKLGVTLDPSKETGKELLLKLLQDADIFVENQQPSLMKKLKLDFKSVKRINPRLIMTSITPYGQTGPYRDWKGYDINCSALGGISNAMGSPGREPLTPPLCQGYYQGGLMGAIATMIALFERDITGKGLHVDVSIVESWATFHIGVAAQTFLSDGRVRRRSGHRALHRPYPDEVLPCKDGYVCIDTPQKRQWERLLQVMGNPEWANDPIFNDRIQTTDEYADKADAYLTEWLMKHTKEEIFKMTQDNRIPAAPIRTVEEVVNDAQLEARGFFVEVDHPDTGKLKYPGACYQLSETPFAIRRPAPRLGEHNEEIFCRQLGYSKQDLVALTKAEVI
jgi:crotonobetainyl-CoA:carnitine CoA-transferase CaiB-like acyl-CoA transferase